MALLYKLREELQEEGYDEQTDVHAVDIGIGSHDDLVVTQGVETLFYVESSLKEVKLLVLVDHLLGETERVERLAAQREHRLCVYIAALRYASACRQTLGYEDRRLFLAVVLGVGEMDAAVAQLLVVKVGLL